MQRRNPPPAPAETHTPSAPEPGEKAKETSSEPSAPKLSLIEEMEQERLRLRSQNEQKNKEEKSDFLSLELAQIEIKFALINKDIAACNAIMQQLRKQGKNYTRDYSHLDPAFKKNVPKTYGMAENVLAFIRDKKKDSRPLARENYLPAIYELAKKYINEGHKRRALFLCALILFMTQTKGQEKINDYNLPVNLSEEEISKMRKKAFFFIDTCQYSDGYPTLSHFYLRMLNRTTKNTITPYPNQNFIALCENAIETPLDKPLPGWLYFIYERIRKSSPGIPPSRYFGDYLAIPLDGGMVDALGDSSKAKESYQAYHKIPQTKKRPYYWKMEIPGEEDKEQEKQHFDEIAELMYLSESITSVANIEEIELIKKSLKNTLSSYYRALAILMCEVNEDPYPAISTLTDHMMRIQIKISSQPRDSRDEQDAINKAVHEGANFLLGRDIKLLCSSAKEQEEKLLGEAKQDISLCISTLILHTKILLLSENKKITKPLGSDKNKLKVIQSAFNFITGIAVSKNEDENLILFAQCCLRLIARAKENHNISVVNNVDAYLLQADGLDQHDKAFYQSLILANMFPASDFDLMQNIQKSIQNNENAEIKQEEVKKMDVISIPSAPPLLKEEPYEIVVPAPAAVKYKLPSQAEAPPQGEQEVEEVKIPEEPEGIMEEEPGAEPESPRPEGVEEKEEEAQPLVISEQVVGFVGEEEKKQSVQQPKPAVVSQAREVLFATQKQKNKSQQDPNNVLTDAPNAPQGGLFVGKEKVANKEKEKTKTLAKKVILKPD